MVYIKYYTIRVYVYAFESVRLTFVRMFCRHIFASTLGAERHSALCVMRIRIASSFCEGAYREKRHVQTEMCSEGAGVSARSSLICVCVLVYMCGVVYSSIYVYENVWNIYSLLRLCLLVRPNVCIMGNFQLCYTCLPSLNTQYTYT